MSNQQLSGSVATPSVSVVIPVHNGAGFVTESIRDARRFLENRYPEYEIVIVDDGSTDGTAAALGPLLDGRVHLIVLPENLGKFAALRAGMAMATGRCRVFTDADLPYDLEAVPYIVNLISGRAFDIVVGDRALPESVSLTDSRIARKLSSRVFSYCVRMLVTGGLFDSQCGIKGFRDEVADALFPLSRSTVVSVKTAGLGPLVRHFNREPVGNTARGMGFSQSAPVLLEIRYHRSAIRGGGDIGGR